MGYNKKGNAWLWGGVSKDRMGFPNGGKDLTEPTSIDFEVKKSDNGEIVLEAFIDDVKTHRKVNTEYITKF